MIRPAERFNINIVTPEPRPAPRLTRAWTSPASATNAVALAAILGSAVGGFVPTGRAYFERSPVLAGTVGDPVGIEPAAGPPAGQPVAAAASVVIPRAPDGSFYAAVAINQVPVAMRLEPFQPNSSLSPHDAARLAGSGHARHAVRVAELSLAGRHLGPVEIAVGPGADAPSVLGAGLLNRLAEVAVEGDALRLSLR
jgi:hypothetical protein